MGMHRCAGTCCHPEREVTTNSRRTINMCCHLEAQLRRESEISLMVSP